MGGGVTSEVYAVKIKLSKPGETGGQARQHGDLEVIFRIEVLFWVTGLPGEL